MTSWRDAAFAVVDVETTGLDAAVHEVLSIGVVDVVRGRVQVSTAYYREVRPQVAPSSDNVVIHGIRPVDAAAAADPDATAADVMARLQGRVLVAHVAWVEKGFLGRWLGPHGWQVPDDVIDTDVLTRVHLARGGRPAMREHVGLGAAAGLFGLPEERRHHALGDALTTAQLLLALASAWPGGEPTVRDLATADRRLKPSLLDRLRR
jgi:DNA polymerase-3 subunit epsilon